MQICCSSVLTLAFLAVGSSILANTGAATGLDYPVVPKGDEEIRFQINASHTNAASTPAWPSWTSSRGG